MSARAGLQMKPAPVSAHARTVERMVCKHAALRHGAESRTRVCLDSRHLPLHIVPQDRARQTWPDNMFAVGVWRCRRSSTAKAQ